MTAAPTHDEIPYPGEATVLRDFVDWFARRARKVAFDHAEVADRAEVLLSRFPFDRRTRTSIRCLARQNRRAAWQHLILAARAERLLRDRTGAEFDDVFAVPDRPSVKR
ncbi:hypothetical protein [Fimbriiglobus ruber]|uniref:Uncharacterized protein n=1 Tax=Fimbriiglobus ruber TaxID=1908690 RepID=A0A225DTT3_9BACT|nr:hypothetical protein [Fimbriiglobus ruber]OWK44453.1 hypothetical protein FRUB_02385 [Fimbriiglobus ruber]